jgi:predicted DCC family thiol-disulfide oxidoreductase YuxK
LPEPAPLLLYDGYCALCNGWVKFVLAVDRDGLLRFAPLGGEAGSRALSQCPDLATIDSIVLVRGSRIDVRSTAVLEIFRYLGSVWRIFLIGYLIPREIRDSLYDVVAHWRYRLFGRYDACPLPPTDSRNRFLA